MGKLIDSEYLKEDMKRYGWEHVDSTVTEYVDGLDIVEAIPKADCENHLKAEKIAMLEELKTKFENYEPKWVENDEQAVASCRTWEDFDDMILQKINALKGEQR